MFKSAYLFTFATTSLLIALELLLFLVHDVASVSNQISPLKHPKNDLVAYIHHTILFPLIPPSAGFYHIHSPSHFMEPHGFALPGFKIVDTWKPEKRGEFITTEFSFKTHFSSKFMNAKIFSDRLNTSHILLMDPDKKPFLLGKLSVKKHASRGHKLEARGNLLRPATVWERMFGGDHLVNPKEVERAIKIGYSNFREDMNLKAYFKLILELNNKNQS